MISYYDMTTSDLVGKVKSENWTFLRIWQKISFKTKIWDVFRNWTQSFPLMDIPTRLLYVVTKINKSGLSWYLIDQTNDDFFNLVSFTFWNSLCKRKGSKEMCTENKEMCTKAESFFSNFPDNLESFKNSETFPESKTIQNYLWTFEHLNILWIFEHLL